MTKARMEIVIHAHTAQPNLVGHYRNLRISKSQKNKNQQPPAPADP